MRSDQQRDRAIRIRQAAMRADAIRSIMPLCDTETAVATIIERRTIAAHDRREVKRS
jgi:hypothetical protein